MLEALYKEHYEELVRYCFCICRDRELAQDMTQEVFLKAMQNLDTLEDLSPKQRRAWLYKAVRNLVYDKLRRKALEERYAPVLAGDQETEPDYGWVEMEQLLLRLPPRDRALFQMRYAEGYNATELGELFALPPSTVRASLLRSRKALAAMLTEKGT